MEIFQACDIRGVAGTELSDVMVRKIALALGTLFKGRRVVVGGDVRISTPALQQIVMDALVESGCTVLDIGTVPTPVFYFALGHYGTDCGVMVTASHNPARYNGLKPVLGARPVLAQDIQNIARLVAAGAQVSGPGRLCTAPCVQAYVDYTAALVQPGRLRVVLDAGNGACSTVAPRLFRRLGYDVVELYCTPDGTFPHRPPNPALPENIAALGRAVRQSGAQLGVAFDGDGDRVAFVDATGRAVPNDVAIVLFARACLAERHGTVVYDAKCSMAVPEAIAAAGGRPVMARAGRTYVQALFQQHQAVLAGEISGHFFFQELGYDDGMYAALRMCGIVNHQGPLAQLAASVSHYVITPDIRVPYNGDKEAVIRQTATNLSQFHLNMIDGVRLEFPDGWGMVRASVTEPLLTLRLEAKTAARLGEIARLLLAALPAPVRAAVRPHVAGISAQQELLRPGEK